MAASKWPSVSPALVVGGGVETTAKTKAVLALLEAVGADAYCRDAAEAATTAVRLVESRRLAQA